jgi:RimJ/RimL family protein N-acetyltransferase
MISLEKFENADFDKLISWIDSPEALMQFAGPAYSFPLTKEQLDQSSKDPTRYAYKVVDTNSNNTVGHAEIHLTNDGAILRRILIGDTPMRGKGLCSPLVDQLLHIVFGELNQVRVELNVFDWNTSAIKCYEKAGFIINPNKVLERTVNGKTWFALNMVLDKDIWISLSSN